MAQRAGRITCPRCGANNFDTVTSCWKCGSPVGAAGMTPAAPMPAAPAPVAPQASYPQERAPVPASYSQPAPVPYPAAVSGDTGVARRAALALALTIPFIGLPVGWIFMMIEDRNKQAVGRWCAMWSMIGLVLHLGLTYLMFQQAVPFMTRLLLPAVEAASRRGAPSPDSLPGGGLP